MSKGDGDTTGVSGGRGERLFYRDDDEFKEALDAASESIRKRQGFDLVGHTIWWGLLAVLALLYITDLAFDWDVRHTVIPGVDLTKPVWVLIIGLVTYHHVWTRRRHERIVRDRLCLKCGASLVEVETDDAGDAACPSCGRAFNLGEFRRPAENRGRGFQGYIDRKHFDKTMFAAAEQIRRTRGNAFESELIGVGWILLGVSFGAAVVLDWDVLDWVPGPQPNYGILLGLMAGWSGIYYWRIGPLQKRIAARRLCMTCGYCLEEQRLDDDGVGRCPECGGEFMPAQYDAPVESGDASEVAAPKG